MRPTPRKAAATFIVSGTTATIYSFYSIAVAAEADLTGENLSLRVWFVLILFGIPATIAGVSLFIHGWANGWWFAVPLASLLLFPAAMAVGSIGAWLALIAAAIAAAVAVRFLTRPKLDTNEPPGATTSDSPSHPTDETASHRHITTGRIAPCLARSTVHQPIATRSPDTPPLPPSPANRTSRISASTPCRVRPPSVR